MRKTILLLTISLFFCCVYAQKERNQWYFGMLAGMQFDGNNYSSLGDNTIERRIAFGIIEGPDNIICANDQDGNLMFYSDGRIFKNRLHQNMLNSPTDEYAFWESQAAIARDPGNPNRYYVFITIQDGLKKRLSYTLVDMSLDNGLGGLVPNKTHILMANDVGQHMVTARHANGKDVWLICLRNRVYHSFLITENGISTSPITSTEGVDFFDGNAGNYGVMEISPNNELIAAGFPLLRKLFLLKFDDLTGKLDLIYEEEEIDETIDSGPFTGIEFSSNSKVLYTTYFNSGIQQYDISDLENIPPRYDVTTENATYPYLKRGPDGTIFSNQRGESFIGAINNPNSLGEDCNYRVNVLGLSGDNLLDLPTFLSPKYPEGISFANICEGETTEFNYETSLVGATYNWDLGDGTIAEGSNILHTYADYGTYIVSVEVYDDRGNLAYSDSDEITIYASPTIASPNDIYECSQDVTLILNNYDTDILNGLDSSVFRVGYYFSESDALLSSNEIIDFTPDIGSTFIWVRVENLINSTCYTIDSFKIVTPEFIEIDMPDIQYICNKKPIDLNAPDGFISYEWSTGETTQSISIDTPGLYILSVIKDFGDFTCESTKNITVKEGDVGLPVIGEINVIDWSSEQNSIEVIMESQGVYEYSIDGINYQPSNIFGNLPLDDYRVYVRDANCLQVTESETLFLLYYDKFFTPNGDGVNDLWKVINSARDEDIEIEIYDRYGKLLHTMLFYDRGWDGNYNGTPMPTSDYWFKVVRSNGNTHFGHFTLKR
ncbi:T9SS type B sorting domain-containing protein [Winogradskyella sp. A3E31]|uniref:T9SS type B sorting domain-containing protein n=1 Tax=Winogradskyella sp. A3E31 TaxID=3349637 RepID=UPI00398BBAD2